MLRHFFTNVLGIFVMIGFPVIALCLIGSVMEGMATRTGQSYLVVVGWILVPYLLLFLPMWLLRTRDHRAMRSAAQEWARGNGIDPDTLGPWVLSGSARTGFAFLGSDAVVLISLEGQRYIHSFNVNDLVWETRANARGITAGLVSADIWPPAGRAPRHGYVKIRHMGHIPGEVTGRLKHAGISA